MSDPVLDEGQEGSQFACESCGAFLAYEPGTQAVKCSHCGHENQIAETAGKVVELDFQRALADLEAVAPTEEKRTIKCTSCAATFSFDEAQTAGQCPYCGGAIVTDPATQRRLTPKSLLPFQIKTEEARDRFKKWLSSRWFAPNDLKRYAEQDGKLQGLYVPHWTYDCKSESFYRGARGIRIQRPKTVTQTINGKTTRQTVMQTEMRWIPVSGRVRRNFDDLLVLASKTLPGELARDLSPWTLSDLKPYQEDFLAGYRSEVYQVDLATGFEDAKQQADGIIRGDVRRQIGGDAQRIDYLSSKFWDISFKHCLLPIWAAAYRYSGKVYPFLVNGQTGKVVGKRPYSWIKIAAAVVVVVAIGVGIYFLTQNN